MAHYETSAQKIRKLVSDPRENLGKIIPFILSKTEFYKRCLYELFGLEKLSRPYPNHEELLKYITKKNGFFVECGGNDGYYQDPTYYLEKFKGWKGIIVEPLQISRVCKKNRKNSIVVQSACVSSDHKTNTISIIDCHYMSFIKDSRDDSEEWIKKGEAAQKIQHRELAVHAQTIQSIIDEQNSKNNQPVIDLFVADVEGYELEILRGLDFQKNAPIHILLEIGSPHKFQEIESFLKSYGYLLVIEMSGKDFLFKKI